jgi:prophage regulatory protein
MNFQILRLPRVMETCSLSRSTIYLRIKQGLLPPPVSLGLRSIGWIKSEIEAILAARVAGKTDDEIRVLVRALEAGRKGVPE